MQFDSLRDVSFWDFSSYINKDICTEIWNLKMFYFFKMGMLNYLILDWQNSFKKEKLIEHWQGHYIIVRLKWYSRKVMTKESIYELSGFICIKCQIILLLLAKIKLKLKNFRQRAFRLNKIEFGKNKIWVSN